MSDTKAALVEEITREGMQMAIEANSAAMIVFNAKVQKIADAVGVDISEVTLTEAEERNKTQMLESVGKRLMRIMELSAQAEGQPVPTPAEAADALEVLKDEIWPDGSITGRTPSTTPNTSAPPKTAQQRVIDAIQEKEGGIITQTDIPEGIDDETADKLIEAIQNAGPPVTDPADLFEGSIFEDAEPVNIFVEDGDTTAEEDTLIAQQQAAEEPLFKSYRSPAADVQPENEFTVYTWGGENDEGFGEVDFESEESRLNAWKDIVSFYCDEAQEAVKENWLCQAWADRLKQEFASNPDQPVTSSLELPEPGDVSQGVLQTVAQGENEIGIRGMTDELQVVEALMTAFMVTATRFNQAIGAALLEKRLAQLGMTT